MQNHAVVQKLDSVNVWVFFNYFWLFYLAQYEEFKACMFTEVNY